MSSHLGGQGSGSLMEQNLRGQAMMGHSPLPSMPSSGSYYGPPGNHHPQSHPQPHNEQNIQMQFARHIQSMVMDGHHEAAALRIAADGDPSGLLSRIHANSDLISVPVQVHDSVNQNND